MVAREIGTFASLKDAVGVENVSEVQSKRAMTLLRRAIQVQ